MPINDPIRGRKIAPDSLAFDPQAQRGIGLVTYQQELDENVTIIVEGGADGASEKRVQLAEQHAMTDAIEKMYIAETAIGEWHHTFMWQIDTDCVFTTGTFDPLQFHYETLRTVGCRFVGSGIDAANQWQFNPVKTQEGVWIVGAQMQIKGTAGMGITGAKMAIFINDSIWCLMCPPVDTGYAGENPMLDIMLHGVIPVPLKYGEKMDVRVLLNNGLSGDQTMGYPTSVQGCVWGHRVRCESDIQNYAVAMNSFGLTI